MATASTCSVSSVSSREPHHRLAGCSRRASQLTLTHKRLQVMCQVAQSRSSGPAEAIGAADQPGGALPGLEFGYPLTEDLRDSTNDSSSSSSSLQLPDVDWSRYHLQVLFIDGRDTLRARMAQGLFEKVAEWTGYGRALYAWTCGVEVGEVGLATRASLMSQAAALGIPPKTFARPCEAFELEDLDRFDVVVALDGSTRELVLRQVDPMYASYYADKVRLLHEYHPQLGDQELLATGGLALLPRSMSAQLGPQLERWRRVSDIERPDLTREGGVGAWNEMVLSTMLGVAGLAHYLINSYPPDLPHYDPQ